MKTKRKSAEEPTKDIHEKRLKTPSNLIKYGMNWINLIGNMKCAIVKMDLLRIIKSIH